MGFPDIEYIEKLMVLCRKKGVASCKVGEFEFTFSDTVPEPKRRSSRKAPKADVESQQGSIETDGLSSDELLFWSTGMMAGHEASES